ncbi:hypothetical protein DFH11DRAFT_1685518 [Phellopilus nigrolimitatus]|nr:hypothetical protein DFH11DRAFT_1685518 [Phellopilus nigrolimitatus]
MFDPSTLPCQGGQLLLVTDSLASPADFVILSILAAQLKNHSLKSKCIFVSFSQTFSHWKSVAARLSPPTHLSSHISNGSFKFLDALTEPHTTASALRLLYDKISRILDEPDAGDANSDSPNMIVLDSISFLEWSGISVVDVKCFVRALRALCNRRYASLVIRHHRVLSDDLDDLARSLLAQCAWHLEVLPLSSGRSGAISGEVALHRGPLLNDLAIIDTIQRNNAVQYRLSDTGALYFGRGTSAGIL